MNWLVEQEQLAKATYCFWPELVEGANEHLLALHICDPVAQIEGVADVWKERKRRMKPRGCDWNFGQKCLLENASLGACAKTSAVN